HASDCPPEVDFLTATVDVQRGGQRAPGRLYYLVTGWNGTDGRSYDLAWGHLILAPIGVQPTTGELHSGLDRMAALMTGLAAEWGRPLARRGVDVGDRQDELRLWLTKHPDWWAIKGAAGTIRPDLKASIGFDLGGTIYRREQQERNGRWWLYIIDTDPCRREAQAAFRVPPGKAGAAHLPKDLVVADTLLRHYCATCEIPDGKGGSKWSQRETDRKHHPEYQLRHDLLDCRTYAVALARSYQRELIRKAATPAPAAPAPPAGWVNDFTGGNEWTL
nr:phage terminase large subunit family protein [Planctomycetota bacterium]